MAKEHSSLARVSLRRGSLLWLSCLSVLAVFSVAALARPTSALQLQAFWDQGQFWVPQTYDNHWVPIHPSGWEWARKAADFYYANPQGSNVLGVNPNGGRGKHIRAVHGGIAQIKAVRFSCGAISEQADLIITSGTLRTGYSHLEPNSPIRINDSVTVYTKEDVPLNLRQCAGTSCAVITTLSDGTRMNVIGGPLQASGFTWWQLQRDVNSVPQAGWAIEGDGVRKTLINSLIHRGEQVVVYDPGGPGLRLRQCAGTSCAEITTMPIDGSTRMQVIGGPTQAISEKDYTLLPRSHRVAMRREEITGWLSRP